ncbi:hypothetical protein E2562_031965 [Oryza meyeriana var. granulata]|uniref:Uncharacterized protein n=1 Tax=Oryza meyeriana var. granulata TaxID=110450 RepID=A0A6G1ES05_9ORYZ|nr:hypothetical protein E2562_031965 [Oryza meyeriana var. granulata]
MPEGVVELGQVLPMAEGNIEAGRQGCRWMWGRCTEVAGQGAATMRGEVCGRGWSTGRAADEESIVVGGVKHYRERDGGGGPSGGGEKEVGGGELVSRDTQNSAPWIKMSEMTKVDLVQRTFLLLFCFLLPFIELKNSGREKSGRRRAH